MYNYLVMAKEFVTNVKDPFRIYEDLKNATSVKIHFKNCGHYLKHVPTSTTKWHKARHIKDAEKKAKEISKQYGKGWRHAKCCIRNRKLIAYIEMD